MTARREYLLDLRREARRVPADLIACETQKHPAQRDQEVGPFAITSDVASTAVPSEAFALDVHKGVRIGDVESKGPAAGPRNRVLPHRLG